MSDSGEIWNPRYVAYAKAHGRTPKAMLVADKERYPGSCMAGFQCWMRQQWQAYSEMRHGSTKPYTDFIWSEADQADFTAWLGDANET